MGEMVRRSEGSGREESLRLQNRIVENNNNKKCKKSDHTQEVEKLYSKQLYISWLIEMSTVLLNTYVDFVFIEELKMLTNTHSKLKAYCLLWTLLKLY